MRGNVENCVTLEKEEVIFVEKTQSHDKTKGAAPRVRKDED